MSSIDQATPVTERVVRRRSVRIRLDRDGLATVAFLLPLLVVFGLFAWFPIVRALVMSVQETNLVSAPTFVGLDNFGRVFADPNSGPPSPTRPGSPCWPSCSGSRCRSSWRSS